MDANRIDIESIVAQRDGRPYVLLRWGEQGAQFTPAEARAHAYRILECAEAAESDAFLVDWITTRVGVVEPQQRMQILADFRRWRQERIAGADRPPDT